ncbi:MAG: dephospho-CoA kinase [Methylomonas lenta]|nr:dephospho-CoA kinase [Methylomonas lenta]
MLRVGLTGGIGSGKSTVCDLFAELGVPIVDADVIARQLVAPGQPALTKLAEVFGLSIIEQDGSLNRALLRQLAFSDLLNKQKLDAIMHPLIYDEIETQIVDLQTAYCIMAIPLLLETQKKHVVDRVLVVDCPLFIQLKRLIARDKVSTEQAEAIIALQAARETRLAAADDVIDNSASQTALAEQVKSLHNSYLLLATSGITSA